MKGLVRNNFYSMETNLQLAFGISVILIFAPIIAGGESIFSIVLAIQSFIFVGNIGAALNVDVSSKWSNFELTMPVKRTDIVKAKYISFVFLILCGVFMSALTSLLSAFVIKTVSVDSIIWGVSFGVSLSFIATSLMYPAMLKLGTEKNELILMICAGLAATLIIFILKISIPFFSDNLIISRQSLAGLVSALFSIILFIISYVVSLTIYKRKDL